jgi:transcriptional regulator
METEARLVEPYPAKLLPGTLDLLVLRTLARGPNHGYGIAECVRELSRDVFRVGESSLYPALQRLTLDGYIQREWGVSENNRRARYYTLTAAGRRQLAAERKEFERIVMAMRLVLDSP